MKLEPGAAVSFTYKGKPLKGVVVTATATRVSVKLSSGYNLSAAPEELSGLVVQKPSKTSSAPKVKALPADASLPKISILHTGGTIASKVDYETGAVIAKFSPEDLVTLFPELQRLANVESRLVANIQSEMLRFGHWNLLADAVKEEVAKGARGVIVTHGTDVLAMTAAALSFALEQLPIPVLLVGSQRSSDRPSSDAASNLLCATAFLTKSDFVGVGICMHEGIANDDCVVLPACRTRKMHTSRRDAFKAVNDEPFARIHYLSLEIEKLRVYPAKPAGKLSVKPFDAKLKVGLLQVHPHMHAAEFLAYEDFDGLVLGLLGIGHAPTMHTDAHNAENAKIMDAIATLAKKLPVVAAPQTLYGCLNMNVYSPGRQLLAAGVLGQGTDVTPETAFVKLAWLLSNHKKDVARLYGENLRGEFSERILP